MPVRACRNEDPTFDAFPPGGNIPLQNRVPVTDYESQPRVPHHRTYGSVSGGSARTRDKPA